MIRTTVMLPEETHAHLRRLARRRGVPLAALIRGALTDVVESEPPPRLSFIGAADDVDAGDFTAASTADMLPPIMPPVSDPPSAEEVAYYRRLADERERQAADSC